MFKDFDQARQYVSENEIQNIDLKYCDLWGKWRHLSVPASQFKADLVEYGIGFDGSSVGLKSVKAGDMVLTPDLSSGFLDPFWDVPTLSFICTILSADTHGIVSNDPRNLAQRAEAYLAHSGIATHSLWGPEFEFCIFENASYHNEHLRAGYYLNSPPTGSGNASDSFSSQNHRHSGYHAAPPEDRFYNLRNSIALTLEAMGIPVKYHHHEVGCPSQMEIETPMMGLVSAGDAVMMVKYTTRMVSARQGKAVTFMPKPIYGEAGNGLHFHQHIFDQDMNLFYDAEGYGNLSQTAHHYIGGLLHHGAAVLALTNPSTNSYRRLVPGYEAPVNAFYSLGNRSAAIRIPKYASQPDTVRIEFRPPDATSNPYLALAAQLMAGIDGIQKQIDPTERGFGPIDADVFSWTEAQRSAIKPLPASLESALHALSKDYEFLLAGGVFTEEIIDEWIEHKREMEFTQVRNRPHPYEYSLYFDF